MPPEITLQLTEYNELIAERDRLIREVEAARSATVTELARNVDERLNRLAGFAIPIVKFAMAHLSPESVHGWPRNDLRQFLSLLRDRPIPSIHGWLDEHSWVEDAHAFVEECADWDGRRERRQAALRHESATSKTVAYMAHPIGKGAARSDNLARATRWFRYLINTYPYAVCVPWYVYATQLEEASHRDRGLRDDLTILERCDRVVLVGGTISEGMQKEATRAKELGKLVEDLTHLGPEPPL